jgi:hypothetical protein
LEEEEEEEEEEVPRHRGLELATAAQIDLV